MKTCLLVLCAAITVSFDQRAAGAAAQPRLQGTFVQLTKANADWDAATWERSGGMPNIASLPRRVPASLFHRVAASPCPRVAFVRSALCVIISRSINRREPKKG